MHIEFVEIFRELIRYSLHKYFAEYTIVYHFCLLAIIINILLININNFSIKISILLINNNITFNILLINIKLAYI